MKWLQCSVNAYMVGPDGVCSKYNINKPVYTPLPTCLILLLLINLHHYDIIWFIPNGTMDVYQFLAVLILIVIIAPVTNQSEDNWLTKGHFISDSECLSCKLESTVLKWSRDMYWHISCFTYHSVSLSLIQFYFFSFIIACWPNVACLKKLLFLFSL